LDINDPANTFAPPFLVPHEFTHEDLAGNPLHFALISAAALGIASSRKLRAGPFLLLYGAAAGAAFLFFGAIFRWQPWNSRLLLPLLILSMPVAAVVISRLRGRAAWSAIATLLAVASVSLRTLQRFPPTDRASRADPQLGLCRIRFRDATRCAVFQQRPYIETILCRGGTPGSRDAREQNWN